MDVEGAGDRRVRRGRTQVHRQQLHTAARCLGHEVEHGADGVHVQNRSGAHESPRVPCGLLLLITLPLVLVDEHLRPCGRLVREEQHVGIAGRFHASGLAGDVGRNVSGDVRRLGRHCVVGDEVFPHGAPGLRGVVVHEEQAARCQQGLDRRRHLVGGHRVDLHRLRC